MRRTYDYNDEDASDKWYERKNYNCRKQGSTSYDGADGIITVTMGSYETYCESATVHVDGEKGDAYCRNNGCFCSWQSVLGYSKIRGMLNTDKNVGRIC